MSEFIGSRISLISKRDIRYVGTLHEISSENSTVALEKVVSYGTEGRRPDDEVPPSLENVYEYIVFRGSDVKDLRIEEGPKENEPPKPPQIPDDPAILGSTRKPTPGASKNVQSTPALNPQPQATSQPMGQQPQSQPQHPQQGMFPQQRHQIPAHFPQHQYPYQFPPNNQRFGPQVFPHGPPGGGFPGMPYGAPPGWIPPYGYPHMPPGHYPPPQMPIGPPGQQPRQQMPSQPPPGSQGPPQVQAKAEEIESSAKVEASKPTATVKLPSSSNTPVPASIQSGPPPPCESKPDVATALAPPAPAQSQESPSETKAIPTGPKGSRIVPAIPLPSPAMKAASAAKVTAKLSSNIVPPAITPHPAATMPTQATTKSLEEANRDARAAVAAAMAKLPNAQKKPNDDGGAMENLTKKVNEMRTTENSRTSRHPGTGGYVAGQRGNRGAARRGREQTARKIEVPQTDYDFESANAKFSKQDLVKEAIASGSPLGSPDNTGPGGNTTDSILNGGRKGSEAGVTIPPAATYNKSSSFFDDISSEIKDRAEREDTGQRMGGREFRNEERQKNLETFGQGSVDNGYRYGRGGGRGRGRGFGGRGRGGRGSYDHRGEGRNHSRVNGSSTAEA